MLSRPTASSINRSFASVPECPRSAVTLDAPIPCSRDFRPLPSGKAAVVPSRQSASPVIIENQGSFTALHVRPFSGWCHRLLWPLLTSAAPSRRLATPVAHPNPMAERRTSQGKTHHLHSIYPPSFHIPAFIPYTRRIYAHILPDDYRASGLLAPSPGYRRLLCGSCSSGRNFAYGCLQIPGRPGHPCRSANGSRHQGP